MAQIVENCIVTVLVSCFLLNKINMSLRKHRYLYIIDLGYVYQLVNETYNHLRVRGYK